MFRVGQKVVLVNDDGWSQSIYRRFNYPVKGPVYTIRDTLVDGSGENCLRLVEIKNEVGICSQSLDVDEVFFAARRFRPIVSRPTSIAFAHEILRSVSAPAKERAHV